MGYDDLRVLEARNFLASVRDGEQREPGVEEMLATARVLAAIERSAESAAPGRRRDERARRQRPAQLRRLRDDGRHRLRRCPTPSACSRRSRAAGYAGTDLGPPGYLGEGDVLRERLDTQRARGRRRLRPDALLRARALRGGLAGACTHTLDLFDAAGAAGARPVLCDAGGPERIANPGRGGEDASLRLDDARWRTLVDGVERAAERARASAATSRSSTTTRRPTSRASRRSSASSRTPTSRCCSTPATCSSPAATRCRRSATGATRIGAVHVKDVRLDVLASVKAERADTLTAWRRGLFCALGRGRRRPRRLLRRARRARLRRLGRRRAGPRARATSTAVRGRRARAGRATATG